MPNRIALPTDSLRRVPTRNRDISTSQSAVEHVLVLRHAAHGHLNLYRWRWDHLDADASDGRRALAAVGHGRRAELSQSLSCLGTAAFALVDQSEAPLVLVAECLAYAGLVLLVGGLRIAAHPHGLLASSSPESNRLCRICDT